jgi:tight adherence protein B
MSSPCRRLALVAALVLWTLGALGAAVAAQEAPDDVYVRGSSFEADGTTRIVLSVDDGGQPLDASAFSVVENGQQIVDLDVEAVVAGDAADVVTMVAIDASTSMAGEPLREIQNAARVLVDTLTPRDIPVGLLAFSAEPRPLVDPTTDRDELLARIETIEVEAGTALYDTVLAGIDKLPRDGLPSLIVMADGHDNRSSATVQEAVDVARDAGVAVHVVAFETTHFEPSALRPLAAETGGRFIATTEITRFSAIFEQLARELASQYELSYRSLAFEAPELDLTVEVTRPDGASTLSFVVPNPRIAQVGALPPPPAAQLFDAGWFGTPLAFTLAVAVAFAGLALFLLLLFVPASDRAATRNLRQGLASVTRTGPPRPSPGLASTSFGQRAVELVESVPRPEGYDERMQQRLDRAGWQLRASEFTTLQVGATIAGFALGWALTGRLLFGLLGSLAGAFGPLLVLSNATQRRRNAFMEQLPDALQLLSGTLKAGYGILQGIDTIVQETEAPMSEEFQRVLTEARLGLPLEDSLDAMADRVGSDDFRWVVVAMNIQRQVGGNLAELLETVSTTLREREQVRRQIKVLSAEGRLSAVVLVALPFVVVGYLFVTNPTYLMPLFVTQIGLFMLGGVTLLMLLGIFWMSRMIKIDI